MRWVRTRVDRSFVSALGHSDRETALTESVVRMAGNLRMTSVAEGIESTEQLAILRSMGCPYGQGFLFSRPVDALAMQLYLRRQDSQGDRLRRPDGAAIDKPRRLTPRTVGAVR